MAKRYLKDQKKKCDIITFLLIIFLFFSLYLYETHSFHFLGFNMKIIWIVIVILLTVIGLKMKGIKIMILYLVGVLSIIICLFLIQIYVGVYRIEFKPTLVFALMMILIYISFKIIALVFCGFGAFWYFSPYWIKIQVQRILVTNYEVITLVTVLIIVMCLFLCLKLYIFWYFVEILIIIVCGMTFIYFSSYYVQKNTIVMMEESIIEINSFRDKFQNNKFFSQLEQNIKKIKTSQDKIKTLYEEVESEYLTHQNNFGIVFDPIGKKMNKKNQIRQNIMNIAKIIPNQPQFSAQSSSLKHESQNIYKINQQYLKFESNNHKIIQELQDKIKTTKLKITSFTKYCSQKTYLDEQIKDIKINTNKIISEQKYGVQYINKLHKRYLEQKYIYEQRIERGEPARDTYQSLLAYERQIRNSVEDSEKNIKILRSTQEKISLLEIEKYMTEIKVIQQSIKNINFQINKVFIDFHKQIKEFQEKVIKTETISEITQNLKRKIQANTQISSKNKIQIDQLVGKIEGKVQIINTKFVPFPSQNININIGKGQKEQQQRNKIIPSTNYIDIVFCLDTTGSMEPQIAEARSTIESLVNSISQKVQTHSLILRFGVVAYQDHRRSDYLVKNHKFSDNENILSFIKQLKTGDGGDLPQAVADALQAVLNLDWLNLQDENTLRYVFLVTDAPPQGNFFTGLGQETKCTCGKEIKEILAKYNENNICWHLIKATQTNLLEKADKYFKQYIQNYDSVFISKVQTTRQSIVKTILEKISKKQKN